MHDYQPLHRYENLNISRYFKILQGINSYKHFHAYSNLC
jgi:hypothetical protein